MEGKPARGTSRRFQGQFVCSYVHVFDVSAFALRRPLSWTLRARTKSLKLPLLRCVIRIL
jgi:hypothetical protein